MSQDNFENDKKTTDAVVRNLEIIGEAAGRLPESFTNQHSEILWCRGAESNCRHGNFENNFWKA